MLSPEYKILKAYLDKPSKELYGREIERLAKTTHERTIKYLKDLVRKKVLARETRGRQVFFKVNKNSELAIKALSLAEMERKTEFMASSDLAYVIHDVVARAIKESQPYIHSVLLFGSVARKQQKKRSDIDLLFILLKNGRIKSRIESIIKQQSTITGKEIQLHTVTVAELEKRWSREPVYRNVWDERIVFFGEENFWRFVLSKGEPL